MGKCSFLINQMQRLEDLENKYLDIFISRLNGSTRKAVFITKNILPTLDREIEQQRQIVINESEKLLNESEYARKEKNYKEI
mgnify:CR=1 FL=1|jgi:hypothetical protein